MAKTVLIIDDSASMRQMVAFTLRSAGFEVAAAEDGKCALDLLDKVDGLKPELVITDLNMPVMDGIEFIRQLRGRPGFRFIPVVVLTTEFKETKKEAGRQAGASGWIVKPFTTEQLIGVVKKFVK